MYAKSTFFVMSALLLTSLTVLADEPPLETKLTFNRSKDKANQMKYSVVYSGNYTAPPKMAIKVPFEINLDLEKFDAKTNQWDLIKQIRVQSTSDAKGNVSVKDSIVVDTPPAAGDKYRAKIELTFPGKDDPKNIKPVTKEVEIKP
jgi:hypothetical protein